MCDLSRAIRLLAPAKLNLFLSVAGKRPDGYHLLCSVMQAVGLYDEISLKVRRGKDPVSIRLTCSSPEVPLDQRNTAFQAALLFCEQAKRLFLISTSILRKGFPLKRGWEAPPRTLRRYCGGSTG